MESVQVDVFWHWQHLYWDCSSWESAERMGTVLPGNLELAGIVAGVSLVQTSRVKWVWQRCLDEGKCSIEPWKEYNRKCQAWPFFDILIVQPGSSLNFLSPSAWETAALRETIQNL